MNFDAWQTIWLCVACSLLVLGLDSVLAHRAGPTKTELARQRQRSNRTAQRGEGKINE